MKRYPRSFLQLVTIGHLLVLVPLLVAGGYVLFTLDKLNNSYQAAVRHAASSSRLSGELTEDMVHMERALRRYQVLRDIDSFHDYQASRLAWQHNNALFARLPSLGEPLAKEFRAQTDAEEQAFSTLKRDSDFAGMFATLETVRARQESSLDLSRIQLERDEQAFRDESDALRTRLLVAATLAVSVALCCLWVIRRLLASLIGNFEKVVLRLGKGELQEPISLEGPGDLRWLGRWLEWLRRRLASLEESRTQVLRHVSHELKTPLAAMHEGASLLDERVAGPLTDEQARIVGILQTNSRRLQDLIEGLLRLQQTEHESERLNHERLAFDQLIEEVLETYRLSANEREIRIECVLLPTEIIAGRQALVTVIHNLLSNAVKYSPDGGRVRIALHHDAEQAVLEVVNEGPEIGETEIERIFDPFYRGAHARGKPGIGLGLAIAREFVLAHRGTLEVLPMQGGAHFRVTLPMRAPYLRQPPLQDRPT